MGLKEALKNKLKSLLSETLKDLEFEVWFGNEKKGEGFLVSNFLIKLKKHLWQQLNNTKQQK